ncbi:putative baseplate tail tube cap [Sinorhizobium phage phiM9]|uniref:Putative baseplate tail tube cap n=1 Tax=Sinorhizobium phage phiM9 TaxID=1636182 RepID=A0A0F6R7B3_9CAUD|nr:putative baseplate tail tube cap [Sinorhizobium phage phiM9]AKE44643.1 putative baseplate tail tube cap [Sinorhizobium phage phiM9]
MINRATTSKSFDFSPNEEGKKFPKMQITSKKVIPTSLDDIGRAFEELNSGALVAPRTPETVMTLELPAELSFASEFDWSFEEKNFLQFMLGSFNSNKTIDTVNEKPEAVFSGLAQRIAVAATSAFGSEIAYRNAGYALAPLKEIFFNGNGCRTFTWSWDIFPKNKQEADNVMLLADRLREEAHPTMQDVGVFQIPNEFEIEWINCKLPKISTCACTAIDANYSAAGAPRFLSDGNPAFIRLSMAFTEINIQTRNTLEQMRSSS